MDWLSAQEDPYYQARVLEEKARGDGNPRSWSAFGAFKAKKGSYTLAVLGHLNAAILHEQSNQAEEAGASYENAFQNCLRAGSKELAVIVMSRYAALEAKSGDFPKSASIYERLGELCEGAGALFLAADAYEHAAGMLENAGRDISEYSRPSELWERNARYWDERGHQDDAQWSRRHARLYKRLAGGRPG